MERYTKDQNDFIIEHGAEMTTEELYTAVNEHFGCQHTKDSVRTHAKKLGVRKKKNTLRRAQKARGNPVGTVKVVNGFKYIRTSNEFDNFYKDWKPLHRQVWESIHGKIPEGYTVVFLNGNKLDCSIDNLACVSNAVLAKMANGHGKAFWSEGREITKAALLMCELDLKLT